MDKLNVLTELFGNLCNWPYVHKSYQIKIGKSFYQALHYIRTLLCIARLVVRRTKECLRTPGGHRMVYLLVDRIRTRANEKNESYSNCSRNRIYQPVVEEVTLFRMNPDYSYVRLKDGRESIVSIRHLAPFSQDSQIIHETNNRL